MILLARKHCYFSVIGKGEKLFYYHPSVITPSKDYKVWETEKNFDNSNTKNIGIADYFSYAHWNPYRIQNTVSPQRMSSDLTSWATGLPFFCPDPTVQYKTCV